MYEMKPVSTDETPGQGIDVLLRYASEINIDLDDHQLNALGTKVVRDTEEDEQSRADWMAKYTEVQDIVALVSEEKSFPFDGASNVVYPLLTEACLAFANRSLAAVFDDQALVSATVNGDDPQGMKQEQADRVAAHLNYQMMNEMSEWRPDMRKLLFMLPAAGCMFRKIWWSAREGRPMSCLVRPEDFIVNNNVSDLKSAPRQTMRFKMWPHQITEQVRAGMFNDVDYGLDPDRDEEQEFYEQIRRIDLDEDGYPEPYVVTVHVESSKVARVKACFGSRVVMSQDGKLATNTPQGVEPTIAQAGDIIMNGDKVQQIMPMQYFEKYGLIPDPKGGFYDWGFGHIVGDLNEAVTTSLRQMIDASTLRNAGGGLLSRAFKGRQGSIQIGPGVWQSVDVSSEDLAKGVLPNPNPEPSPMGLQLIEVLVEASRSMTTQSDVASGDVAAQMAPTTMMALADQAMTGFRGLFKGVYHSLTGEVEKFALLNRLSMDGQRYFKFHDSQEQVSPDDYNIDDMDIVPSADPEGLSPMQKASRGQMLLSLVGRGLNDEALYQEAFRLMKFGDFERFQGEPQQPDPMAQMAVQLQAAKLQADIKLIQAKVENERVDSILKRAEAVNELAQAEAEETGAQMAQYMRDLDALQSTVRAIGEVANVEERVRGVAGPEQTGIPRIGPTQGGIPGSNGF